MPPWKKGQSGNPAGRPSGFVGLAQRIRDQTGGGAELVEFALAVFRGSPIPAAGEDASVARVPTLEQRIGAHQWLTDRGFGKAVTPIDLTTNEGGPPSLPFDPTKLSPAALAELEGALDVEATESDK